VDIEQLINKKYETEILRFNKREWNKKFGNIKKELARRG